MKTIRVPVTSRALNALLDKARRGTIVLESAEGERFALTRIDDWEAFEVGSGRSFAEEVRRTGRSRKLMKSLAARRGGSGESVTLAEVRKELGLD